MEMSFNPDPLKQAQGINVSLKMTKTNHPTLIFNDNSVHQVALQKHLGMPLDCKLNFEEHLKTIFNKINKTIDLLRKFQNFLQRNRYLQYINPLSHHTLVMVTLFMTKLVILLSIKDWNHFNAMIAITGAICGTSKEKLYYELGLESLRNTRCHRKLSFLYNVIAILLVFLT